jgi:hypothetical protein
MSISHFTDKAHKPSAPEIATLLGAKQALWDELLRFFRDNYQLPAEFTFGGKNYGWNVWYRKGGKSLASLYPQKNGLVVQLVLGKDQVVKAGGLSLGKNVERNLQATPQLHDGRWLFLKVTTRRDVQDVEQLVRVKRRPTPA